MTYFKSNTFSGKLAIKLGITLVLTAFLEVLFALAIGGDSTVVENNPLLIILAGALSIIFTLAAPLSFFIGIYTIIKHQEWSIWKPLAVSYFITVMLFLLGEFLFPH